jgi:DeoR family transcriptional regulator, fructose operon transcriptional repressor
MNLVRRQRLLLLLNKTPPIRLGELAEILAVSPRSLNSDLKALISTGEAVRFYGDEISLEKPAIFTSENPFVLRSSINKSAKREIARWAAGLVQDGDTILMDASTTVFNMVSFLAERRNLVVLTNGIETGRRLAENSTNSVILMAGILRSDGASVIGPLYEPALRSHPIKTAFVSCQGFSLAAGLTETDANEAAVKNRMVTLADSTVALIDSSKFGQVLPAPFARADQISHIFSDSGLEPDWAAQVQEASIVLTLCQLSK